MRRLFSYKYVSIRYNDHARESIYEGIKLLSDTVANTLGPRGRPVAIEYELGSPKITKDGVTVAKHIDFGDSWKDLGARLLKFPAHESNVFGGDGTTTATVIAAHIIEEAFAYMRKSVHPIDLKNSIREASSRAVDYIQSNSVPITSENELRALALVATSHDEYNADLVARAVLATGKDGNITVEEGNTFQNQLIIRNGLFINRGVASEYFLKDIGYADVRLDEPLVLTASFKIHESDHIVPLLEYVRSQGKSLLIAAEDLDKEALSTVLLNVQQGEVVAGAINYPYEFNQGNLADLAAFCGATLVKEPSEITPEVLGTAQRANLGQHTSLVYSGGGSIKRRLEEISYELSQAEFPEEIEVLKERMKRLSGKMAVIEIGMGGGNVEIQERRDRIVDALNSVQSGFKYGILPGGASALFYAARSIAKEKTFTNRDIGFRILRNAMAKPLEIIARNSPRGIVALDEMWELEDEEVGLDALSGNIVNLIDSQIIDSTWIVVHALRSAVSLASMLISTSAVIARDVKYFPTRLKYYRKDPF